MLRHATECAQVLSPNLHCLPAQVARYAAKFAADWVCLELLTHCLYFNSIAKHRIGLRYRQHGLQYGTLETGEYCTGVAFLNSPARVLSFCTASVLLAARLTPPHQHCPGLSNEVQP